MERFLASNEWQWRLLRTIVRGVFGQEVARTREGQDRGHAGHLEEKNEAGRPIIWAPSSKGGTSLSAAFLG